MRATPPESGREAVLSHSPHDVLHDVLAHELDYFID